MSEESRKAIDRAHRAAALLADGVFVEACESLRSQLIEEWAQGEPSEKDYEIKLQIRALADVQQRLRRYVSDGRIAEQARETRAGFRGV